MSGTIKSVGETLRQRFVDGNFIANSLVQYENLSFTPPTSEAWVAFWYIPAQPRLATLGEDGTDELNGIVQIDLNFPKNKATGPQYTMAEEIKAWFKSGSRFVRSETEVWITSAGYGQGREVNGFHRVPLTIAFGSRINR